MEIPHGGAGQIWRDQGHNPIKGQIRDWGGAVEASLADHAGALPRIATIGEVKQVPVTVAAVYLTLSGREGAFSWNPDVEVATHQADEMELNFIAPNAVATGAWVRVGYQGVSALVEADQVRGLQGKLKEASAFGAVSELTDPTLPANKGRRIILLGQPPVEAYCDGQKWWDLSGGVEIDPWWLPRGASLHCDFENNRFYWDGAVRALGDLTAVPAGGYSLAYDMGFTDTACVAFEYTSDNDVADLSGTVFSWTSGYPHGDRIEFFESPNGTYGDGVRLFVSPGDPQGFQGFSATSKEGELGARYLRDTRQKMFVRIKSGELHKYQPDNGEIREGSNGSDVLSVPTLVGFGNRAWSSGDPDEQLTGAQLNRVTVWPVDLSDAHVTAIGQAAPKPPVLLLGDSFLNTYGVASRLEQKFAENSKVVSLSQDGVGGSPLSAQADRFDAYEGTDKEKWWDSTLVICDFGFEDPELGIEAIKRMLARLNHDRWIYMQPAPSNAMNEVSNLPPEHAVMKVWCGDRFVSTLQEAWDAGDGSQGDNDLIAVGKWPLSLVLSSSDFHPNAENGHGFIADQIYAALTAKGWI